MLGANSCSHEAANEEGTSCSKSIRTLPRCKAHAIVAGRARIKAGKVSASADGCQDAAWKDAETSDGTRESHYCEHGALEARANGVQGTRKAKATLMYVITNITSLSPGK